MSYYCIPHRYFLDKARMLLHRKEGCFLVTRTQLSNILRMWETLDEIPLNQK